MYTERGEGRGAGVLSVLSAAIFSLDDVTEPSVLLWWRGAQAGSQMTHAKVNYTLKGFNIMKRSICMREERLACRFAHHTSTRSAPRVSLCVPTDVS